MSRQAFVKAITYADEPSGNLKIANSAEVSVFNAGTETLAKLYEERTGGALISNPFILDATALADFWADSGDYDIKVHDTKGPARFGDFTFGWQSSPPNAAIEAGDLSNEGDIQWSQDLSGAWIPQLQPNSVGAAEIAPDSVGSSEIAENAVGANEILTGSVGTLEIADGSVTSRKSKLTIGIKEASADLACAAAMADIAGAKLEITPSVDSYLVVVATFQVEASLTALEGTTFSGAVNLDNVDQSPLVVAKQDTDSTVTTNLPFTETYILALTAAAHTIKLRAKKEGPSAVAKKENTRFLYALIAS